MLFKLDTSAVSYATFSIAVFSLIPSSLPSSLSQVEGQLELVGVENRVIPSRPLSALVLRKQVRTEKGREEREE